MAIKKGTLSPKVERYLIDRIDEQVTTGEIIDAVKIGKKSRSAINKKLSHLLKQNRIKRIGYGLYQVLPSITETTQRGFRKPQPKNGNRHAGTHSQIQFETLPIPSPQNNNIPENIKHDLQQIALIVEQLNLILERLGIVEKVN